jgi:hypothetical protein
MHLVTTKVLKTIEFTEVHRKSADPKYNNKNKNIFLIQFRFLLREQKLPGDGCPIYGCCYVLTSGSAVMSHSNKLW